MFMVVLGRSSMLRNFHDAVHVVWLAALNFNLHCAVADPVMML